MKEDIKNYSPTVRFRGAPYMIWLITGDFEKVLKLKETYSKGLYRPSFNDPLIVEWSVQETL